MVAEPNKWGTKNPRSRSPCKSPLWAGRTNTKPQREEQKIIHSIHEGFACGGKLWEDQMAYTREPIAKIAFVQTEGPNIVFIAKNTTRACLPHKDVLMVTFDVAWLRGY